jgi:hypothetical protein
MSKPPKGNKKQMFIQDIQSIDKPVTGFKIIRAELPKSTHEIADFKRSNYRSLANDGERGWLSPEGGYIPVGEFEQTLSAVQALKTELPNTKKRMSRSTYRNYLISKNRNEVSMKFQNATSPEEGNSLFFQAPNRIAMSL